MSGCGDGLRRRLETMSLPARVVSWAKRKRIETLEELVRWHPTELRKEPNVGAKTVLQLREVIWRSCGAEWEALWAEVHGSGTGSTRERDVMDWESLHECLPRELLARELASLDLPARMMSFVRRAKLTTVSDLVGLSRTELTRNRGLGRGTIEGTLQRLIEYAGGALDEPEKNERKLPGWLLATSLEEVHLPARMRTFVERNGLETVADLVAIPRATLLRNRNLGRASLESTWKALFEMAENPPRKVEDYSSFWALWTEKLEELDALDRLVLRQRSGIGGESRTLMAIGETLGVSRERARQIESRAIKTIARGSWVAQATSRLEEALIDGALALEELETRDPWFGPLNEGKREALAYFLRRIVRGPLAIGTIDGREVIAGCRPQEMEASFNRAVRALAELTCPVEDSVVKSTVAGVVSFSGLVPWIMEALEARIHRDEEGRMIAFGCSNDAEVLAFLRRCPTPVRIHDVFTALGKRVRFPDEVFYFERGVVGLETHFPDYPKWKVELIPVCVQIMERDPRQWRVPDLFDAVREEVPLPEWFGHWNLAEILRRSPEDVCYLGRLRVTLHGLKDKERVHFSALAQQILEEHGGPLSQDELMERMKRETTIAPMSLRLMVIQAPFVEVDEARIGLLRRDVPGGREAIARFGDALFAELERSGRGLSVGGLTDFISNLGGCYSLWTVPMARGVARMDPRFQLARRGGGVGLTEWEDVRVPSRVDLVRKCVEEYGGRAPIAEVLARLQAHDGAKLERRQLGALAHHAGMSMRGEELVMPEQVSAPERSKRDRISAGSRAHFEEPSGATTGS